MGFLKLLFKILIFLKKFFLWIFEAKKNILPFDETARRFANLIQKVQTKCETARRFGKRHLSNIGFYMRRWGCSPKN